jgi:hypothetical protein
MSKAVPSRSSPLGKPISTDEREQLMKYLMLVCWDAQAMNRRPEPTPEELQEHENETFPWLDDVVARGVHVTGDQLAPPRRGKTVRFRDGKRSITEGPFIETKEAIGGFDIIECESFDEAVEIAAGHPVVAEMGGTIEVRPFYGG